VTRRLLAAWTSRSRSSCPPILLIGLYAFNPSNVQGWPIGACPRSGSRRRSPPRDALGAVAVGQAALLSTGIALALGTLASFAVHRFTFFGREAVSFLLILPLALPGIITGMALNSFFAFGGLTFSLATIVVGHATFCIVVVYNNVLARLRRTQGSLVEASMDLGADGLTTFRLVTLPLISTALVGGALLAFALSFDEVIVRCAPRPRGAHRVTGAGMRPRGFRRCAASTTGTIDRDHTRPG